jgi:hypothetical protein
MPTITVTAALKDITLDPKVAPQYKWDVTVEFKGSTACKSSMARTTSHTPISQSTGPKNQFTIPFTQVRGGELTVKVAVTVGATVVNGQSKGLTIVGNNPIPGSLIHDAPNKAAFRKLMSVESPGLLQFLSPGCPRFSGDNFGGVGLCQLTYPAPTDDQVWSWKENLKGGIKLWNEKEGTAKKVAAEVRKSADFQALVTAYNKQRAGDGRRRCQESWKSARGYAAHNRYPAGLHGGPTGARDAPAVQRRHRPA